VHDSIELTPSSFSFADEAETESWRSLSKSEMPGQPREKSIIAHSMTAGWPEKHRDIPWRFETRNKDLSKRNADDAKMKKRARNL
jgi:hypothetical protein